MNILITALYPTEACPVFALELAKALIKKGHNIYSVLPDDVINLNEWISLIGDEKVAFVHTARDNKKFGMLQKYTNVLCFFIRRSSLFSKFKGICFDICFYAFYHGWNSFVLSGLSTKQNILFIHDPIPHSDECRTLLGKEIKQCKKMDGAIVLTRKFKPIVSETFGFPIDKVYYMPLFPLEHSNSNEHRSCQFDNNESINFLFFGRINKYKGLDILLKAYALVSKRQNNCELTIAGNGDISEYSELLAKLNRVTVHNKYIEDSKVNSFFLKKNTILVLPYIDATQSGVLSVAYANGNPVIASDTGGLREQLDDGNIGILFKTGDIEQLAEKMEGICKDRNIIHQQNQKMLDHYSKMNSDFATSVLFHEMGIHN